MRRWILRMYGKRWRTLPPTHSMRGTDVLYSRWNVHLSMLLLISTAGHILLQKYRSSMSIRLHFAQMSNLIPQRAQ